MHNIDACLDKEGNALDTIYCEVDEDGNNLDPTCEPIPTTLEYPEHIVPEYK
jgi:hypothetical protein